LSGEGSENRAVNVADGLEPKERGGRFSGHMGQEWFTNDKTTRGDAESGEGIPIPGQQRRANHKEGGYKEHYA